MGKTIDIGGRLHSTEQGNVVAGANEIYDDTKGKKQDVINGEVDAALEGLDQSKQDNLTFDQTPTENSTNPVTSGGVYAADTVLQQAIDAILTLIPSAASALNQLADKQFVNSSIATSTATFRGTYNLVSDLHLSVTASHADIATALASVVSSADNQDYAFVQVPTSDTSSDIRVTERYKFNGEVWMYEYDLNNSGFTAQQWEAINSTITLALVQKLGALPTAAELATLLLGKQNVLTFDNVPTSGSDNPVKSGGLYEKFTAIDAKMPSDASADNKLVAENRLAAYVGTIIEALDASFNLTSADGHVTFRLTQADGQITSVQIATDDIASAAALTALGGRVSTNERDIDALQDAYAALTQSDIVIVNGALPSSGQQQNIIYRQPDPDHNPPQFYSDYMWNGTTWVLMATYNNAIDPRPKKGSQNLVTSGGVFDNMGALDVSELNATENPHALATYADLSAALAAIPSDYQKGGMSIKFVQASDNMYVQYRLMSDGWSTDTDDWSFCGNDILIENPEWVNVVVDKNGKILYGVKTDGNIYFGAGCPPQVKEYVLQQLRTKVDKVEGKALIDKDYAASTEVISNPEWLQVTTDSAGKIIRGIYKDGTVIEYCNIEYPNGIPSDIKKYIDANLKQRKEKKVLWLGTSISETVMGVESVHTINACHNLGRDCINNAKGSSYLARRYTPETLVNAPAFDYCLSQTIAEYEEMYRPFVTQGVITEEELNFWKGTSYEKRVIPFLNEIDTIIFEHAYNDSNKVVNEVDNPDWNSKDRTTFVGAFNYLMEKIFEVNPFIKIIIVPYFQNKTNDSQKTLDEINKIILMSQKIADKFGYPYLPIHDYCPFDGYFVPNTDGYDFVDNAGFHHNQIWEDAEGNAKRFQLYCPDGVHPYSIKANVYLESIYTHLLRDLI